MSKKKQIKPHSEKKLSNVKYGMPWCSEHDSLAVRRYDPFLTEVCGLNVARYLCDECYYERSRDI